ncbi:glyoxalase/bleomycin resistance protein/dioxygenase [Sporocytophaga myxococcoides]|uniref:Glyoxalase/bleomycin resistance protein/dioxygenase n=1 Tax=Sporocytophaga myxococcoides TaxID=153721 RepID=A0A098LGM5_9BACT|nr:VOC family protein [Sporocytophaga myxococcoides]GAL86120.1 glyoxalase/bleomycin resistance protein/dioxygenase [Sporocytophaga myxococcoides]
MTQINPYLTFNGNCEVAFRYYQSVFGGKFSYVKRYSQLPAEYKISGAYKNKILNIALPINEGCTLIGGDANPAYGGVAFGKNITLSVNASSKDDANKIFNTLSIGGKVFLPMDEMFWGAYSGMCEDRFGMNWMINFETNK